MNAGEVNMRNVVKVKIFGNIEIFLKENNIDYSREVVQREGDLNG